MTDLFQDKAREWDTRPLSQILATGVSTALLAQVPFTPEMRVMDFGAGTGLLSSRVAPLVKRIHAVDLSPAMLEQLVRKPELAGKVEPVCQDITRTALDQSFNVIMSAMALHHVENTDRLLACFSQHLVIGGFIALADLDKEDGSFHPDDAKGVCHLGFERDALRAKVEAAGFHAVSFTTALEVTKEEKIYPIFLLTAKK